VLRPASRRVAELVGYLGFVPVRCVRPVGETGAGGAELGQVVAGVHPERVIVGTHPGRGVVLTGTVTACRPAGAGWEADLRVGQVVMICRLADRPMAEDGRLVVTALEPPCFGPDGSLVPVPAGDRSPVWPEQVSA
jgi:hypothetical protein